MEEKCYGEYIVLISSHHTPVEANNRSIYIP